MFGKSFQDKMKLWERKDVKQPPKVTSPPSKSNTPVANVPPPQPTPKVVARTSGNAIILSPVENPKMRRAAECTQLWEKFLEAGEGHVVCTPSVLYCFFLQLFSLFIRRQLTHQVQFCKLYSVFDFLCFPLC